MTPEQEAEVRHKAVVNELTFQRNGYADVTAQLGAELAVWNARWNDADALRARLAELES